jgi:superfamily I DNA/RNA helicase
MRRILLGPPGTGKTTVLVNYALDLALKGEDFMYLTFSSAAAKEAYRKFLPVYTASTGKEDPKRYRNSFRTIHSFAYEIVGAKYKDLMSNYDYNIIFKSIGLPQLPEMKSREDIFGFNHISAKVRSLHRKRYFTSNKANMSLQVDLLENLIPWEVYSKYTKALKIYKDTFMKIDFDDLLIKTKELLENLPITVENLIVDEAQDLSIGQWNIIKELDKHSLSCVIAGDDDQEIYKFAGSDVETFYSFNADDRYEKVVLNQSYRVPVLVHNRAQALIQNISKRYIKPYNPTKHVGKVLRMYGVAGVIDAMNRVDNGEDWFVLCRTNSIVKNVQDEIEPKLIKKDLNVRFMTIHQSKGLECKNVVVFTRYTSNIVKSYNHEEEIRLFYVAITRTIENLVIVTEPDHYNFKHI